MERPARIMTELALRAREARHQDEYRAACLACLRALVDFDSAVFSEVGNPVPLATLHVPAAHLAWIERCERGWRRYREDLRRALAVCEQEGAFIDTELYSAAERSRSRVYAEVILPQEIRSMLTLMPRWRGEALGVLRLQRHGGRPFARADQEAAQQVLPVLELGLVASASRHRPASSNEPPELELTSRESEIAELICRGLTTPEIAELLGTSKLTVRNQLSRIFRKANVSNRTELAALRAASAR